MKIYKSRSNSDMVLLRDLSAPAKPRPLVQVNELKQRVHKPFGQLYNNLQPLLRKRTGTVGSFLQALHNIVLKRANLQRVTSFIIFLDLLTVQLGHVASKGFLKSNFRDNSEAKLK